MLRGGCLPQLRQTARPCSTRSAHPIFSLAPWIGASERGTAPEDAHAEGYALLSPGDEHEHEHVGVQSEGPGPASSGLAGHGGVPRAGSATRARACSSEHPGTPHRPLKPGCVGAG
eukprot:CAMPEP_0206256874 /NCGR_PEP_ID=MMETSP0047_2-20121206/25022_1 /ASSEMBLY_ACC=CAM_ASM_000192 /TAXON_ID=195065 /ORGANISM="Chroomonas mesostigmatica_cf, Strain CCMP1168" /LENGTH=115 /DNA_ID=CAMNT_0053683387 /DNA_START=72 /DNA_END=415 /DNA_ORIENTATION=-